MKWEKVERVDEYGKETGFYAYIKGVIIVDKNSYACTKVDVVYLKDNNQILFSLEFDPTIFGLLSNGYVDVKNNSEEQNFANLAVNSNCLSFTVAGLTLECYRKSYEGKLVQLCWMDSFGGHFVEIKTPVWEE